jgi:hypothetical protein
MHYLFIILLLFAITTNAQVVRLIDARTYEPITDALLLSGNKHLGTTDATGTYKLQPQSENTNVCIKAFGYRDTCVRVGREDVVIHLKPIAFETQEVSVEGKAITAYDQLMQFLGYSLSLCNQQDVWQTYDFEVVVIPIGVEGHDKVEGRFSYQQPSAKKRRDYRKLYLCHAHRTVSRHVYEDSLLQQSLVGAAMLPVVMWYLDDMYKPTVKMYKNWLKDKPIHRSYTDSTGYTFSYVDTDSETAHITWHFDKNGRLRQMDKIELHERSQFALGKKRGNQFLQLIYTSTGKLMIESASNVTVQPQYTSHTTIYLSKPESCDTTLTVPLSTNPQGWATINKLPVSVVEDR